jgi:hypothetical protein
MPLDAGRHLNGKTCTKPSAVRAGLSVALVKDLAGAVAVFASRGRTVTVIVVIVVIATSGGGVVAASA